MQVLTLWQTAILRLSRLRVRDEINEELRYYDLTLFDAIAQLQRDAEPSSPRDGRSSPVTASTRSCAWVRGSAATATATRS